MPSTLETIAPGGRIAVVRIRSLGDCVLTTPALSMLNEFRPDLSIGVVVEDRFSEVFAHHPAVAEILPPKLASVRRFHPELTINFHGGTRSALLTLGSGARIRAGFGHYAGTSAYNLRIPRAQEILGEERPVHTAEHLAAAMFYLGVPISEIPRASLFAADGGSVEQETYAVMHPFASAAHKAWPVERFVELSERMGVRVVVLAGRGDDVGVFEHHVGPLLDGRGSEGPFKVYRNAPLDTVMRLLRDAALFIGNDSGPAHIAAAYGVPSVVLFGSTNSSTWGPWRTPSKVIQSTAGFEAITVDDCLKAIEQLKVRA